MSRQSVRTFWQPRKPFESPVQNKSAAKRERDLWSGRILKVPPKLAAGSRQNSQAGGLRYVAQASRLRVRGASEPHVPSHRQPTEGGTIKPHPFGPFGQATQNGACVLFP